MATDPRYLAQQYIQGIPAITQAYQNDPRTKLMQSAQALGSSAVPVAGGDWAWADGLSRIGQGILGGVLRKQQERKYADAGARSLDNYNAAVNPATSNPTTQNAALQSAAAALSAPTSTGPDAAALQMAAGNAFPGAGMPPQGGGNGPPSAMPPSGGSQMPPMGGMPPQAPSQPPTGDPGAQPPILAPNMPVPMAGGAQVPQGMDPAQYYYRTGIRPIEGGTDPRTGAFRTSPKGAVGPGQIMPGTGPEAARLAGLPWDEKKWRTDAMYNDALGKAYYQQQLQTFGDPLKAAAAYNAGPGRVRRALRQEQTTGKDWTTFLPAETQGYVQNFAGKVGGNVNPAGDMPQWAAQTLSPEQVPGVNPQPMQAPQAPQLPPEVQSERLAIAQRMLASGDPSLFQMATQMLDKGLGEQYDARTLSSQQAMQQGQTGYSAALSDAANAAQQGRADQYSQRNQAQERNFQRETMGSQQNFQAQQNWRNQNFQAGQSALDRAQQQSENALNRENAQIVAGIKKTGGSAEKLQYFLSTPSGAKMAQDKNDANAKIDTAMGQLQQFLQLNRETDTGGPILRSNAGGWLPKAFNSNLQTMEKIANQSTLQQLGGSLGRSISDGDRAFMERANLGVGNSRQTNERIIAVQLAAMQREKEFNDQWLQAYASGPDSVNNFMKTWNMYKNAVSLFERKDGKVVPRSTFPSYADWISTAVKFDANGKRVQ